MNPQLQNIGQINIPVKDLTRAKAFYADILGLRHLFTVPNMAFFDCAGVRSLLEVLPERQASILYFRVENIEHSYTALSTRGVVFEGVPHKIADMGSYILWMAFFKDSEDNLHALMSEISKEVQP
jgi:predicted enzyme related to lactoylglutathione lyase